MKLAKALSRHIHLPMVIVFPLGMLGIVPALSLFVAIGLVFIAGSLGMELVKRLGADAEAGLHDAGALGRGPTRW